MIQMNYTISIHRMDSIIKRRLVSSLIRGMGHFRSNCRRGCRCSWSPCRSVPGVALPVALRPWALAVGPVAIAICAMAMSPGVADCLHLRVLTTAPGRKGVCWEAACCSNSTAAISERSAPCGRRSVHHPAARRQYALCGSVNPSQASRLGRVAPRPVQQGTDQQPYFADRRGRVGLGSATHI